MVDLVGFVYELAHSDAGFRRLIEKYHGKYHENKYMLVLTIYNEEIAKEEVESFRKHIEGKIVVEIGAGIGLLALEMAKYAKKVYAFELDPAWSWIFVRKYLYNKPSNLFFVFGDAEEFADKIKPDIVIVYTCSAIPYFLKIARKFSNKIILNGKLLEVK